MYNLHTVIHPYNIYIFYIATLVCDLSVCFSLFGDICILKSLKIYMRTLSTEAYKIMPVSVLKKKKKRVCEELFVVSVPHMEVLYGNTSF